VLEVALPAIKKPPKEGGKKAVEIPITRPKHHICGFKATIVQA